jgi:hypothetical protein
MSVVEKLKALNAQRAQLLETVGRYPSKLSMWPSP